MSAIARNRMKNWEVIADNLSKAGWSWGCVSAIDSNGRTIWIADAHRGDGKRFVVRVNEKLTAFVELESAIPRLSIGEHNHQDANRQRKKREDGAQDHGRMQPVQTSTGMNKKYIRKSDRRCAYAHRGRPESTGCAWMF